MNLKKSSKQEVKEEIKRIFSIKNLTSNDIKKIKKLAMSKNIKLGNLRKKFCEKCFSFFTPLNTEIRIKKQNKTLFKIIKCKNCEYVSRWVMEN